MRRYKTFILGGRSGTTLLHQCLLDTNEFIDWSGNKKQEVITYVDIVRYLPEIKEEIFKSACDGFTLAKSWEFDHFINLIISKFRNPKFIVLERDISSVVLSILSVGWFNDFVKRCLNTESVKQVLFDFYDIKTYPNNDTWCLFAWIAYKEFIREKQLKIYDNKRILKLEFNDFMGNFESNMLKVSDFLDIDPDLEKWSIKRSSVAFSKSAKGIRHYVQNNKYKAEIDLLMDDMKNKIKDLIK